MKNKDAFHILGSWAKEYKKGKGDHFRIRFAADIPIGNGKFEHYFDKDHNNYEVYVGIAPLTNSFSARNENINDLDFVKMGVTMFHEFRHYEQITDKNTPKEILISNLSKVGNAQYYRDNWHRLPHEIDAEYVGVMSMWSKLEGVFENADELMLEYVTNRAQKTYMVKNPCDGLRSKEHVVSSFKESREKSPVEKRELSALFLRSDDEIAQMLTNEGFGIRADYYLVYYDLYAAKTGQELDYKMASLASYLHPGLEKSYPNLNFSELDPASFFTTPIPETKEELLSRIDLQNHKAAFFEHDGENDFADAVNHISFDDEKDFTVAVAEISTVNSSLNL